MKDVTDIFKVEGTNLVINKEEIRTMPEFKVILERDRGSEGDSQGRKKLIANKEFLFLRLYHHPLSIYRDMGDKEKMERILKLLKFPDTWKIDEKLKEAEKAYLRLLDMNALLRTYINANKAVYSTGEDIKFYNERKDKLREAIKVKTNQLDDPDTLGEVKAELEQQIDAATQSLMKIDESIAKVVERLPKLYSTVDELKKKLLKEGGKKHSIHGGGKLGNREA